MQSSALSTDVENVFSVVSIGEIGDEMSTVGMGRPVDDMDHVFVAVGCYSCGWRQV